MCVHTAQEKEDALVTSRKRSIGKHKTEIMIIVHTKHLGRSPDFDYWSDSYNVEKGDATVDARE